MYFLHIIEKDKVLNILYSTITKLFWKPIQYFYIWFDIAKLRKVSAELEKWITQIRHIGLAESLLPYVSTWTFVITQKSNSFKCLLVLISVTSSL